ncbi:MAG: rod shape-determining protein MreD [Alphaproteobacteria bacterium]|nr:rod shape-determining protein MreD [Alphaproteobacteria bacterium]
MLLRLCVPYGFILCLFALSTVPLTLPLTGPVEVPLLVMAIYYWSLYRPTLLPVWLVFAAGVLYDLLSGLPVGMHAFVFVIIRWVVVDQRLFLTGQPFVTVWIGYMLVSAGAALLQWGLFGLIHFQWPPFAPTLLMTTLGIFMFPFIMMALHFTHRFLPVLVNPYSAVK